MCPLKWILPAFLFSISAIGNSASKTTLRGDRAATMIIPELAQETNPVPLLIFLHGYGGNGSEYDSFLGLTKNVDKLGYALLLPNGTRNSEGNRFWNATPACCDFENSGIDDAGYLADLIDEAISKAPIDPKEVFIYGHSNGGFMSYRMACDYPEKISGLVSISGVFYKEPDNCKNPSPLKVLQVHGNKDNVIPYAGNEAFASVQASVEFWTKFNQCQSRVDEIDGLDVVSNIDGKDTDVSIWTQCRANSKVGLWSIKEAGHLPYFQPDWIERTLKFFQDQ